MKFYLLILITLISLSISLPASVARAATPTPKEATSSSEASSSGAIDQIRKAVKEKVENRLDQLQDRPVGIIGQVTNITNQNITILVDEQDYAISVTGATEYLKIPGRRAIKREDIALQDYLLVKGTLVSNKTTINADEIQVIPEPILPEREAFTGQITKIANQEIQLKVDDQTYTIKTTTSTPIKEITNSTPVLKLANLNINDTITVVGTLSTKTKNQLAPGYIFRIKAAN